MHELPAAENRVIFLAGVLIAPVAIAIHADMNTRLGVLPFISLVTLLSPHPQVFHFVCGD